MISIEEDREPQGAPQTTPVDSQDSTTMPGEGIEPELNSLSSEILPSAPESARQDNPRNWGASFERSHLFFTQQWHKPYAEALLEDDPAKLPALIAAADQAILTRYLELNASAIPTDERLDLRHAVDALSQLKTGAARSAAS